MKSVMPAAQAHQGRADAAEAGAARAAGPLARTLKCECKAQELPKPMEQWSDVVAGVHGAADPVAQVAALDVTDDDVERVIAEPYPSQSIWAYPECASRQPPDTGAALTVTRQTEQSY